MADLAIGISKAAVEALVNKVKSAIKEEAELWQIVQRDTVFMKDEFEMMQSFLKTADWERIKNNVVRTWVGQVRDLSYDAEDCIESIVLMGTRRRSCWTLCLRLLASCSCNPGERSSPLDLAVAEIKLLKARVEEVSNRNMRYSLINGSGANNPITPAPVSTIGTTTVDILAEAWCTAKKQGGLVDLTMLITENNDALQVISLWGTGGDLGMTSIIKEAYEKTEICQKFRGRAWLKLSHPFNPHEFIRSLADQFYGNSCKGEEEIKGVDVLTGVEAAQRTDLVKEFVRQLKKHKYLVVLEDVSNMAEWHAVRTYLPDNKNGSRIVVSTQQLEIARLCTGQPYQVLELRKLPDNHSICVFFNKGFKRVEVGTVNGGSSLLGMANGVRLFGRSSDEDKLLNLISSAGHSDRPRVISVWGFPGIGKSALVNTVLHRQARKNQTSPFEWYGWVDVSYPFSLSDFCRRMLSYTHQNSEGACASMFPRSKPDNEIIQECAKFLKDHRCFVVIDGLLSKQEWDSIYSSILLGPSQSCIVVVTAEESVTKCCAVQDDAVYRVKALKSEAALQLFKQNFGGTGTSRDTHMLNEANYILAKCGGIPQVIIALAKYLAAQQEDIRQRKLSNLKANFMHELETNPEFVSLRDLFAWMHFSFYALPQSLKPCILYLSVFPQAERIRQSHFVRRWIAEGYSKCTDSKTMEQHAGELFNRLAKQTAAMAEWRVNSFFHEYINSRLVEERVVFFPLVVSVLDGSRSLTTEGLGQHLAIRSSWERDEFVFQDLDLWQLQSLTVSGEWRDFFISHKMKSLRVLDLEGAKHVTNDELRRILKLVPRLRFLSLRGHSEITDLPDSLSGLMHLQTLDIRNTSVVYLELEKLQNLQYIRAGTTVPWKDDVGMAAGEQLMPSSIISRTLESCLPKFLSRGPAGPCNGVKVLRGIRHQKALHTLGAVHVNSADGQTILADICQVKQLKKLEVSGINRKNSKHLCHAIINHKNLESLSLQLEKESPVVRWDDISPPSSVRSLKLHGHVQKLSALRFRNLKNLKKLSLEMTRLFTQEDTRLLGSVPSLRTLRMRVNKGQDGDLQFLAAALFSELHHLEIACKSKLHVKFDAGAMGKLELLEVHCCEGSAMQFSGLGHLVSLKRVWLLGYPDNALKEVLQRQLAEHPKKPALELEQKRDHE